MVASTTLTPQWLHAVNDGSDLPPEEPRPRRRQRPDRDSPLWFVLAFVFMTLGVVLIAQVIGELASE